MRRFEFSEGASNKFWEIARNGTDLDIRWGRIGTQGQSQTKSFADAAKASAALDKLVAEKTGKGYVETDAGAASAVASSEKVEKEKKQAAAPTAASPVKPTAAAPTAVVSDVPPAATAVPDATPSVAPSAVTTTAAAPDIGDVVLDELPPLPVMTSGTPPGAQPASRWTTTRR